MKSILNNPNVKQLIKTFDLETPASAEEYTFEACEVSYEKGSGISIKKIKVLKGGKFVKFAKLEAVLPYLKGRTIKIK